MGLTKIIRDNRDKLEIELMFKRKAKHRCPKCHRFTMFYKDGNKTKCIRCKGVVSR